MDQNQQRANKERNLREALANFNQAHAELNLRVEQYLTPDVQEVVADSAFRQSRVVHITTPSYGVFAHKTDPDPLKSITSLTIFENVDGKPHPAFIERVTDEAVAELKTKGFEVVVEQYLEGAILTGELVAGEVIVITNERLSQEERVRHARQFYLMTPEKFYKMSDSAAVDAHLDELGIAVWKTH